MGKALFGLIVLIGGLVVGWYVFGESAPSFIDEKQSQVETSPSATQNPQDRAEESTSSGGQMMDKGGVATRSVVTYTQTGFAPITVTVKVGTTVTFVNESDRGMWVASAVHPTHQLLPGFDQKASVMSGGMFEYTFTKVGTWKYHNHMHPDDAATVVVTQ